jgi:hypothetical protein
MKALGIRVKAVGLGEEQSGGLQGSRDQGAPLGDDVAAPDDAGRQRRLA